MTLAIFDIRGKHRGWPTARWRVRPIFRHDSGRYGWNLLDPHGLVRRSFLASLDEVAVYARSEIRSIVRPIG